MPHSSQSSSRQESRRKYYERKQEARRARKIADRSSTAASERSVLSIESMDTPTIETLCVQPDANTTESGYPASPSVNNAPVDMAEVASLDSSGLEDIVKVISSERLPRDNLTAPTITEDDLLSFQSSHFGDNTRPDTFFIDPKVALDYLPWLYQEEESKDDDLGCYPDGTKRTLTEAQVALFRHTELQELLREARLRQEAELEAQARLTEVRDAVLLGNPEQIPTQPNSGVDGVSIEVDLHRDTTIEEEKEEAQRSSVLGESASRSSNSTTRNKRRKSDVPYAERHKRKWEDYIEAEDQKHGSLTHRRIIRELDDQPEEQVDMDY